MHRLLWHEQVCFFLLSFHHFFFSFSVGHSVHLPKIRNRSIIFLQNEKLFVCLALANTRKMATDKFILNFNLDSLISIYAYCSYINMIMSIFLLRLRQLPELITAHAHKKYSQLINFVKQSTLLSAADRCFHVTCVVSLFV